MARGKPTPSTVDFHPSVSMTNPVDASTIVAPVAKMLAIGVSVAMLIVGALSAYYSLLGRMDRIDDRMQAQTETLKSLANSISTLATQALTAQDLNAFCLQAQIANQKIGFRCPFTAQEPEPKRPLAPRVGQPKS